MAAARHQAPSRSSGMGQGLPSADASTIRSRPAVSRPSGLPGTTTPCQRYTARSTCVADLAWRSDRFNWAACTPRMSSAAILDGSLSASGFSARRQRTSCPSRMSCRSEAWRGSPPGCGILCTPLPLDVLANRGRELQSTLPIRLLARPHGGNHCRQMTRSGHGHLSACSLSNTSDA
jgi:hypothetical protein